MDTNTENTPGAQWARDCEALEHLVDRVGLGTVLEQLAEVCGEKAAHIQWAWQDEKGARPWRKAGAILQLAERHANVQAVNRTVTAPICRPGIVTMG